MRYGMHVEKLYTSRHLSIEGSRNALSQRNSCGSDQILLGPSRRWIRTTGEDQVRVPIYDTCATTFSKAGKNGQAHRMGAQRAPWHLLDDCDHMLATRLCVQPRDPDSMDDGGRIPVRGISGQSTVRPAPRSCSESARHRRHPPCATAEPLVARESGTDSSKVSSTRIEDPTALPALK